MFKDLTVTPKRHCIVHELTTTSQNILYNLRIQIAVTICMYLNVVILYAKLICTSHRSICISNLECVQRNKTLSPTMPRVMQCMKLLQSLTMQMYAKQYAHNTIYQHKYVYTYVHILNAVK